MRQALAGLSGQRLVTVITAVLLVGIALSVLGVGIPLPRSQASVAYLGVHAIGGQVIFKVGQLQGGQGQASLAFLAAEPDGTLLATDKGRHVVLHLNQLGQVIGQWGPEFGPGATMGEPAGVTATSAGEAVVDRQTPRIFLLDPNGTLQSMLSLDPYGTYGLNGLRADAQGDLFLADTGRNRLLELGPGGSLLKEIGHGGNDVGSLAQPMDLAFAPDGSFYVADWDNSRIARWDANLQATDAWSTPFQPRGVAVDPEGRVYVPDGGRKRVEVYSPSGSLVGDLGATSPTIDLSSPDHAVFAPGGALFVLGDDGIEQLNLQDTPAPPQETSGGRIDVTLPVLGLVLVLLVAALVGRRLSGKLAENEPAAERS